MDDNIVIGLAIGMLLGFIIGVWLGSKWDSRKP